MSARSSGLEVREPSGLPTRHPFWTGYVGHHEVHFDGMRTGPVNLEVQCCGPRYVTLWIEGVAPDEPTLVVPLEPRVGHRYGRSFLAPRNAGRAWLEVAPQATADETVAVTWTTSSVGDLTSLAWRALRRHARSPGVLLAKLRQVAHLSTGRGGNVVFRSDMHGNGAVTGAAVYERWREAFEGEAEVARIGAAVAQQIGDRQARVLAVMPAGTSTVAFDAWIASLVACRCDVHLAVLQRQHDDPRHWDLAGVRSVQRQPLDVAMAKLPTWLAAAAQNIAADMVVVAERPGRWHPLAVEALALELHLHPQAFAAYADHDHLDAAERRNAPVLKPVWSPAYELATGYVAQPVTFRPKALAAIDTLPTDDSSALSRRLLSALNGVGSGSGSIRHVPRILFHQTSAPQVDLVAAPSVSAARQASAKSFSRPEVSLIIPSRDNPDMLKSAYAAITDFGGIAAEIVIVDNGSKGADQLALLADLARRPNVGIVADTQPFNFSRLINTGRAHSRTGTLVLLNDDVAALPFSAQRQDGHSDGALVCASGGWLAALVEAAAPADVGAVGALLLYPDGRVQHGGVILGIDGGAGHAFRFANADEAGVGDRLRVVHEVAAVTGACLAVRTQVFDEVGGFAEDLPVTLNDVDFCLALLARGYRNLMVPHARLIHRESSTRRLDVTPARLARLAAETAIFQRRWGSAAFVDPYRSPLQSNEDMQLRCL